MNAVSQAPRWSLNQKPFSESFRRTKLKDQHMKKKLFVSLALAGLFVFPTSTRAQFAGSVVAYTEGSGVQSGLQ